MFRLFGKATAIALAAWLTAVVPVWAQSEFRPVVQVNEAAITPYEIEQRAALLAVLRAPGDLVDRAREDLVEERLMMSAVKQAGIQISPESVEAEMASLAGRGNLTMEQFVPLLEQNGVELLTFREFARVRVGWRSFVQLRFVPQVNVTEAEVDRALALTGGGLRVLLSEIVFPITPETRVQTLNLARELRNSIRTQQDFERAARRYSAAESRADNGRIDWLSLSDLPGNIASVIIGMSPGDVSQPLETPISVSLLQLRAVAESTPTRTQDAALDYMVVRIPGAGTSATTARMNRIVANTDTCKDLWRAADGLPENAVSRQTLAPSDIPRAIRAELQRMDPDEISLRLTSADGTESWVLMLCGRSPVLVGTEIRDEVLQRLRNQRLEQLSENFISALRAAAKIEGL